MPDLIARLQERNADRKRTTDGGLHPLASFAVATACDVEETERILGFPLPELLRALYREVANGGFGPQYGIVGTAGGFESDGLSLAAAYTQRRAMSRRTRSGAGRRACSPWRATAVACGAASTVTAASACCCGTRTTLDSRLAGPNARVNWANAFWDQGLSLEGWIEGWLDASPEPEPRWPTDAWIHDRLGFDLPT